MNLPLYIRFLNTRRNDSVALREFKTLNPDISIRDICLDSAHDNYATYGLCQKWEIRPFIDLNENRDKPASIPDSITIDSDGPPVHGWSAYGQPAPLPAAKPTPATARRNVPFLPMTASRTGTSSSIPRA